MNGERLRRRCSFSVLFVFIRKISGSKVSRLLIRAGRDRSLSLRIGMFGVGTILDPANKKGAPVVREPLLFD